VLQLPAAGRVRADDGVRGVLEVPAARRSADPGGPDPEASPAAGAALGGRAPGASAPVGPPAAGPVGRGGAVAVGFVAGRGVGVGAPASTAGPSEGVVTCTVLDR